MMNTLRIFTWLLALATGAWATSVRPAVHECPVCGTESGTTTLVSYSQFGEPARDLSDSPMFRFGGVEICPEDLYASWKRRWGKLNEAEKARLADFLKDPAVALTDGEKRIVGGRLEELKARSRLWEMLWARTCDGLRERDPRHEWFTAMKLYFSSDRAKDGWQRELADHWRDEAIGRLEMAMGEDWPSEEERRIFPYLRSELMRRAGRSAEAKAGFAGVVENEAARADDPEKAWLGRWASEQSWRIDAAEAESAALADWLMEEMPDPWREKDEPLAERWGRHSVALEALADRAIDGDGTAAEVLWKALRRDTGRLLALGETLRSLPLWKLRETGAEWDGWLEEIAAGVRKGALPGFEEDRNLTRVFNVLGPLVDRYHDRLASRRGKQAQPDLRELLAAVEKAAAEGGALRTELSRDALLDGIARLWKEHPEKREALAKARVRSLRRTGETPAEIDHRVVRNFRELGEMPAEFFRDAPEGEWESVFWRTAAEYLAGMDGAADRLAAHPLAELDFPDRGRVVGEMLWGLFGDRKDPVWRAKLLRELAGDGRMNWQVLAYARAFPEDREIDAALEARLARLREERKTWKGQEEWDSPASRMREIENLLVSRRLGRLAVK